MTRTRRRAEFAFMVVLIWTVAVITVTVQAPHHTIRPHIVVDDRFQPNTPAPGGGQVVCDGDGQTGNRVQTMYVHAADKPDRYSSQAATFRQALIDADAWYVQGAADSGQSRHLRYVTQAISGGCQASLLDVSVPAGQTANLSATSSALQQQGYNRTDRDYLLFVDDTVYCGVGYIEGDDQPGQQNSNNTGPTYARADSNCWTGFVAAHEIGHNLGAVQLGAPHSSGAWHCYDENDVMCYQDGGSYFQNGGKIVTACQATTFDCNHDDYFNAGAPSGWLASHWNVANSSFLIGGGNGTTTTTSTTSSSTTTTTRPTTTTTTRHIRICWPIRIGC